MAVEIEILNNDITSNKQEYLAAVYLKKLFEEDSVLNNSRGNICIGYGLTLSGQKVRDIDLLVFGHLDDCVLEKFYTNDVTRNEKKNLRVMDFCTVIELKELTFTDIKYENTHIYVKYKGQYKDATQQNEDQKYSLMNYLKNLTNENNIFVTNFLWMKSITSTELMCLANGYPSALPSKFSFSDFISEIVKAKKNVWYDNNRDEYRMWYSSGSKFDLIKRSFACRTIEVSDYTRRKLEKISQVDATKFVIDNAVEDDITVLKGKAGTGKTFLLLQYALHLSTPQTGNRCLLLTYNHALLNDIRRLLFFLDIPDGIENHTIQINTLHSFFISLMKIMGINNLEIENNKENFEVMYKRNLQKLNEKIDYEINSRAVDKLKDDSYLPIDWDYILVDEAQDWLEIEKDILIKIYGKKNIIVADGGKQMLRNKTHLRWGNKSYDLSVGRRQKANIVRFLNLLANEMKVDWKQECDEDLVGGKVVITQKYDKNFHFELLDYCKNNDCDNYDILLLVPPELVLYDSKCKSNYFKNAVSMRNLGINIFDRTRNGYQDREQYPISGDMARLYQYESCRGLEGWVVVCMQFDVLLEHKKKFFKPNNDAESLIIQSDSEKMKQELWMWTMLSFSRAVDRLVIIIKDPKSEIATLLHKVADKLPDFVEWNID